MRQTELTKENEEALRERLKDLFQDFREYPDREEFEAIFERLQALLSKFPSYTLNEVELAFDNIRKNATFYRRVTPANIAQAFSIVTGRDLSPKVSESKRPRVRELR